MYLNQATVVGNLTRDPEQKSLPSGVAVTNFSVATNRVWTKDGQKNEDVEYHNIVVFGRMAENVAQYMRKGSQILVIGRLQTRSWEDKDTGKKMYRTEIVAETVQFGSNRSNNSNQGEGSYPQQHPQDDGNQETEYPEDEINPEDIPF